VATPAPLTPPREASTLLAIGSVAGASVAARGLRFVKVLVVARLLAPESFGAFAALTVFLSYGQFLELGASTAAFRDLAAAVGRGDSREAWRAAGRMATLKLAAALLLGAGGLAAALFLDLPPPLRMGLVALPAIALSSALLAQVLLHLQAEGRSHDYGRATLLAGAGDLVLGVGLTAAWGLPGLLLAAALAPGFALAWATRRRALAPPHAVDRPLLGRLVRTGAPLAALALLDQSLVSMDQVLVMGFLSLRDLGLYNVALVLAEAVRTLGAAGGAVLGPRLLREHARSGGSREAIRRHTLEPVLLYAAALPLPVGLLWIAGGAALARFYPEYASAVAPMQAMVLASSFLVVTSGVTTFLFAIDRHARNILFLAPALAFNLVLDVVLLRLGWGLMAIAAGSLATYVGYAAAVLWYVSGHFEWQRPGRALFLAGALLPGLALGGALLLLERTVAYRHSPGATAAACAALVLLASPLALRARRIARRLDEPAAVPQAEA
jgi:O-antigen/teichoic acid export membrane protein